MEVNDPIDLLAIKFLGTGIKLDFNPEVVKGVIPLRGELCLEASFLIWRARKVWLVSRI